jgi:monoamine oxidase
VTVGPPRVVIVGAGLSGLYAASLLESRNYDYVVLEARDAPGGRIASIDGMAGSMSAATAIDRFDLGPAWFWPQYQRDLERVVRKLGLASFAQFDTGEALLDRGPHQPPARLQGYQSSPISMRLIGGMSALVDALRGALDPERIATGQAVRRLRRVAEHVEVDSEDAGGVTTTWHADHVLLALPPRLAEHTLTFDPPLPPTLAQSWRSTATWMAPHAKYVAIYDRPFWREDGLSGEARSATGPLGEIHDASMPGASAALFGFLSVPARLRRTIGSDALQAQCRAQLTRLFGPQASAPRIEAFKDWAQETYTAVPDDVIAAAHHVGAPAAAPADGPWHQRVTGIASEWSASFPGYLAGAIEAAASGVNALEREHRFSHRVIRPRHEL